jgi:hypothetical protein
VRGLVHIFGLDGLHVLITSCLVSSDTQPCHHTNTTHLPSAVAMQCLSEKNGDTVQCDDHIADYMECLHHGKEV